MILAPAALSCTRDGVEVELGVHRDVVLHVVVPLPVPHHRGLQVVPGFVEENLENIHTFQHIEGSIFEVIP